MRHIRLLLSIMYLAISVSTFAAEVVTVGSLKYELNGAEAYISGYVGEPSVVVIPETIESEGQTFRVTRVNSSAFKQCSSITSLTSTGANLKIIGQMAFLQCPNLKHVKLVCAEKALIYGMAFYGCSSLEEVNLTCSEIGWKSFGNCASLQKVILKEVKLIGICISNYEGSGGDAGYTFSNCSNLAHIDLGDKLNGLACWAFENCSKLTYVVVPKTCVKSYSRRSDTDFYTYNYDGVTSSIFSGCTRLQSIIYLGDQTNKCGSNATVYHPKDQIHWSSVEFDYQGKAPTATFTNDMPAGFVPTAYDMTALEKNVGNYTQNVPFTFANDDMSFDVDIPYTYTINPVTLTAKVKDASRLYGDGNPQFSSAYTGFVNNEDASVLTSNGSYTTTAMEKSDVGNYPVKQSGATAQNYVFEYEEGTLTVNKAPLTMTANDKTMTYGGKVPSLDARYEGLKNNETVPKWNLEPTLSTTASPESRVDVYPITISNADAKNYELTINNGKMTVEKAELTVRAENKSRFYGDANPEFTLSYTGLKNGESVPEWEKEPSVVTTATMTSDVGTYPISVESAVAVNYNITPIEGTLTVKKAPLEITPNDATRMYGDDNPPFTLSYVGLKNSENSPEWVTEPDIVTSATPASAVGDYVISVVQADAKNYSLDKIGNGTLTITKAPLMVSVKNYTRKYGENNPNFELSYEGLRNDEQAPAWTETPTITTRATVTSDIGEYTITATGGVMRNYETEGIRPGMLTITPASLLIRAQNSSRLYFDSDPKFTYRCEGFANGDNESVLTTPPTLHTIATRTSPAGTYPIDVDGAEAKNYTLSYTKGELTINKRELTVSTKDYTRAYGEDNPDFELKYMGFVNNENESVLLAKPKATTTAEKDTDTGIYDITIGNGVAENYDFNYISGKLTIEKAYQTLTWNQELGTIEQYEQVELMAEATSGLDVTYTVEGSPVCSIVKIGKKQYLDCFEEGEAVIVAIQEGNKNWWQTTKIYKPIKIISLAGISEVSFQLDEDAKIYDIKGNRLKKLQRGINIIVMGNGTKKKVVVK